MYRASAITNASTAIRPASLPGDGGLLAVVADNVTRETVSRVAEQQGWPHARIERGGIGAALVAVEAAAPRLLLVDLSDAGDPVAALDALAEGCPPDMAVLAIGTVNDVALYRRLIGMGVADYLVKPVSAEALQEALLRAAAPPQRDAPVAPGEARPARVVAMVGARGGAGTTTAAIATAWCMVHDQGLRVTLLDLDLHFGSLALQLDLEARRGLGEALQNPERIDALLLAGAMSSESERLRVLAAEGPLKISDFGTRRRHGFLWQRWCVEALQEGLGDNFIGTSNVKHAMDTGLEATGTNAHELPMVYAALADDEAAMREAPYEVLRDWARMYGGNLLIVLPDCFGSTGFLSRAPDWVADWKGARPDSKEPIAAANELIAWWQRRGRDPHDKLLVLSDAMDIDTIERAVRGLRGRINVSIGWGTNLTNDFKGCATDGVDGELKAISIVCKVADVEGRPAVKLSDNPNKVLGPPEEIARYRRVFGASGMIPQPVLV